MDGNNTPLVPGERRAFGAKVALDSRYMTAEHMQFKKRAARADLLHGVTDLAGDLEFTLKWKTRLVGTWPRVDYLIKADVSVARRDETTIQAAPFFGSTATGIVHDAEPTPPIADLQRVEEADRLAAPGMLPPGRSRKCERQRGNGKSRQYAAYRPARSPSAKSSSC